MTMKWEVKGKQYGKLCKYGREAGGWGSALQVIKGARRETENTFEILEHH
jgi:hypothetical protein